MSFESRKTTNRCSDTHLSIPSSSLGAEGSLNFVGASTPSSVDSFFRFFRGGSSAAALFSKAILEMNIYV